MAAGDEERGEASGNRRFHFDADQARASAQAALHKSEFILSRAFGLFQNPIKEWEQIRDEQTSIPNILLGYVAPLAAIPPVCDLIGQSLFNGLLGANAGGALINAVVTWIVSIALVFLLGIIINALAPNFDADKSEISAQKVAAYSLTPAFLSGFFSLWPPLWWLSLFALAAMVYLMYRGLPVLLKAPEDRALGYAASATVAVMVAAIVLFAIAAAVT